MCLVLSVNTTFWVCTTPGFHLHISSSQLPNQWLVHSRFPINIVELDCWIILSFEYCFINDGEWSFWFLHRAYIFKPATPAWLCAHTSVLKPHMWLALPTGKGWLMLTVDAVKILMSCHFSKCLKEIFAIFKSMPRFLEWNPLINKGIFFWNVYYLEYQKKLIFKYGELAYTENGWFLCQLLWVYL